MPRKNTADAVRWKRRHNRQPGETKDAMFFYELRSAEDVAKILGVSRQRIQQLERTALFKLRRGLKEFWEDFKITV